METTINSLQELIEKKADSRLKNDLLMLCETLSQNRLLTWSETPLLKVMDGEVINSLRLGNILLVRSHRDYDRKTIINVEGSYAKELYQHWLPIYIQEETESFVKNVDSFKQQLDEFSDD